MAQRVVWTFLAKDKFSAMAQRVKRRTEAMNQKFKKLNATLKKSEKRFKKVAAGMKKTAIAAGVAAAASLKAFAGIEKGITSIYGLLSEDEFNRFGKIIDKTVNTSMVKFGVNTEDSTRALYNAISVLGASESTFNSYNAAVKLAIGGNADLAAATLGVGKLVNAYEEFGLSGERAAEIIFVTQQKGAATVDELANSVGKIAKMAGQLGLSAEEYVATIGELSLYVDPRQAVTGVKAIFNALISAKGDAAKTLKKYDLPITATGLKEVGWLETMNRIRKMIQANQDDVKRAIPAIEGYEAAMFMAGSTVENVAEMIDLMDVGALGRSFEMNMQTLDRQAKISGQNLVVLASEIGEQLKPTIIAVTRAIAGFTKWFQSLDPWVSKAISNTLLLAISAGVLVKAFQGIKYVWMLLKIGPVLSFVIAGFKLLIVAVGIVVTAVGWIPIAIGAAIIGLGLLIWKFDYVKTKAIEAFGWVKKFFGFGDDLKKVDVSGSAEMNKSNQVSVDVGIKAPKNTVEYIKMRTTGDKTGLKTGMTMETG